ncbi:MAG: cbb3-type cytochrome oxidase assembly protein CcoS [Cyclobacteriaceae bacterium]
MSVIFLLIGVSIVVALAFLAAFIWAQSNGQYDDDYSPSVRILYDDDPKRENTCQQKQISPTEKKKKAD